MVRTKTSKKQEALSEKLSKVDLDKIPGAEVYSPTENLLDTKFIGEAILECLQNNDPEGVMEVLEAHLYALNKAHLLKKNKMPKSTFYHALRTKNPTIKTLCKMVHGAYSEEKSIRRSA